MLEILETRDFPFLTRSLYSSERESYRHRKLAKTTMHGITTKKK